MKAEAKELYITVTKDGVLKETFYPKKNVTIGSAYEADLTVQDNNVAEVISFIQKKGKNYTLNIPDNVDGEIIKDRHRIDLSAILNTKLVHNKHGQHLIDLTDDITVEIKSGNEKIKIGFIPIVKLKTLRSVFKGRYNGVFLMLLIGSLIIHGITAYKLKQIELKEKTAMEQLETMDKRFARLILKPKPKVTAQKVEKQKEEKKIKDEEKKKELAKKPDKKVGKKESKLAKKKSTTKKTIARHVSDDMAKKVSTKGLLSAMSEGGGVFSAMDNNDMWLSVDTIIEDSSLSESQKLNIDYGEADYTAADVEIDIDGREMTEAEILAKKRKLAAIEKRKEAELATGSSSNDRKENHVYRVVKKNQGGLKFIYNKYLREDPTLKGVFTVNITIVADGSVSIVEIVSTPFSADLNNALKSRIKRWKFGEIPNSPDYKDQYSFDFSPLG